MKIVVLSYADVADTIGVTLLDRGHEVGYFGPGVVDEPLIMQFFGDYDGCMLLGDYPEFVEFARLFRDWGKVVWREWTDIPPTSERPRGGYLASLKKI